MRLRFDYISIAAIVVAALAIGCHSTVKEPVEEPTTAAATAATAPTPTPNESQPAPAETAPAPSPTTPTPADTAAASAPAPTPPPTANAADYTPPFPSRLELFDPPKRAQSSVRHDDESGDTIVIKGFINVNGPRVVLSIGGVIAPIPEGGEKYGVQVISIDPPSVVLQRGRNRWTAKLD